MMDCKVSVIVPVYNCALYLERALDSLISQIDFNENELILIDDGSVDESSSICDNYAERYSNINVVHQSNSGVSAARNHGIDLAKGEWILFLDSDDYLLDNVFEKFMKFGPADIICANYKSNQNDVYGFADHFQPGLYYRNKINDQLNDFLATSNSFFYTCWSKLFKTSIIKQNNIRFPVDRKFAEDMVFVYTYLSFAESISLVDDNVYYYYVNDDNATSVIEKSFDTFCFIYNWKYNYFNKDDNNYCVINDILLRSFLFKSYFSIKTSATYMKYGEAMDYIGQIIGNDLFYDSYVNSDEYQEFKTLTDKLLDKFIRRKKPLLILILFRINKIKSKILSK